MAKRTKRRRAPMIPPAAPTAAPEMETVPFGKTGRAHLQLLMEQHQQRMQQALIGIAEDLKLDPKGSWQPDVRNGAFVRPKPASPKPTP